MALWVAVGRAWPPPMGRRRALIQRRTALPLEPLGNIRLEISVRPDWNGTVTIVLPVTTDCEADGAICTGG